MNEVFGVVTIALLIYIIYSMKREEEDAGKLQRSFKSVLPDFLGKMCEITLE